MSCTVDDCRTRTGLFHAVTLENQEHQRLKPLFAAVPRFPTVLLIVGIDSDTRTASAVDSDAYACNCKLQRSDVPVTHGLCWRTKYFYFVSGHRLCTYRGDTSITMASYL